MIDNIFANRIERISELGLNNIEVVIDGLLKRSAFRLNTAIHGIFFNYWNDILFVEEVGGAHVIMVLFDAGFATSCLLPNTAIRSTEYRYLLTVLTLIHMIINIQNYQNSIITT